MDECIGECSNDMTCMSSCASRFLVALERCPCSDNCPGGCPCEGCNDCWSCTPPDHMINDTILVINQYNSNVPVLLDSSGRIIL